MAVRKGRSTPAVSLSFAALIAVSAIPNRVRRPAKAPARWSTTGW
jgi:hypothetical protein